MVSAVDHEELAASSGRFPLAGLRNQRSRKSEGGMDIPIAIFSHRFKVCIFSGLQIASPREDLC